MKILYTEQFSKDLDKITNDVRLKKNILQIIDRIKQADYLSELENVRKIKGYEGYYRIRMGDFRVGIKITDNSVEMLRCLHRKDIYRRFP